VREERERERERERECKCYVYVYTYLNYTYIHHADAHIHAYISRRRESTCTCRVHIFKLYTHTLYTTHARAHTYTHTFHVGRWREAALAASLAPSARNPIHSLGLRRAPKNWCGGQSYPKVSSPLMFYQQDTQDKWHRVVKVCMRALARPLLLSPRFLTHSLSLSPSLPPSLSLPHPSPPSPFSRADTQSGANEMLQGAACEGRYWRWRGKERV